MLHYSGKHLFTHCFDFSASSKSTLYRPTPPSRHTASQPGHLTLSPLDHVVAGQHGSPLPPSPPPHWHHHHHPPPLHPSLRPLRPLHPSPSPRRALHLHRHQRLGRRHERPRRALRLILQLLRSRRRPIPPHQPHRLPIRHPRPLPNPHRPQHAPRRLAMA